MIPIQNDSIVQATPVQALASGGTTTSNAVSMKGWAHATIVVSANSTTTGALPAAIAIQSSETADATNFATIYSAGTASTGWPTAFTANTSQSNAFAFASIPWLDKKPFLRVLVTGHASSACTAGVVVIKSRSQVAPVGTNSGAAYNFSV